MLDFMLVWDRAGVRDVKFSEGRIRAEVARLRLGDDDFFRAWYSREGRLSILVWGSSTSPFSPSDRMERDDAGLRLLLGWMLDPASNKVVERIVDTALSPDASASGEYAALRATPDGDFIVWRNAMASVQLYYSDEPDRFVVSTRASITNYGRALSTRFELDPAFARSVLTASIALNDHTLFQGVSSLPQAHTIYRPPGGRPVVHRESDQPLYDEDLRRLYCTDRTTYWDETFERLIDSTDALDTGDLPFSVHTSGGKDSRLLLGLLAATGRLDRVESLVTYGRLNSPDDQAARAIARALGLADRHVFQRGWFPDTDLPQRAQFLQHVFVSEGEMSPLDLMLKVEPRPALQLVGQEGGLRNIAGRRRFQTSQELLHWFRVHLANWDTCNILTDEAREANEDEFMRYFAHQLRIVDDLEQIPTKHRGEFRIRRWMARTWGVYNATTYAPYLLASDTVLKATYNAGPRSRSLEEFHFEMLNRAEPQLLEIPFAEQTWDPELESLTGTKPPAIDPFVWRDDVPVLHRRPVHAALQGCFDELRGAVLEQRPAVLEGVVDLDRLVAFDKNAMKTGHVQPLLHLVSLLGANAVSSFADLNIVSQQIGTFTVPDFDAKDDGHSTDGEQGSRLVHLPDTPQKP